MVFLQHQQYPIITQGTMTEGNLGNITPANPIDILMKLGVMEHIFTSQNCSPEEIESYKALFK